MEKVVYVHYGSSKFEKEIFTSVINREGWNKPYGGLWASKVNDDYGWKVWCEGSGFEECDENNSFKFTIRDEARKLRLADPLDFRNLPTQDNKITGLFHLGEWVFPDFEKIAEKYDYIEYEENFYTHEVLYGWDCNCVLILNPDVVEEYVTCA